MSDEFSLFSTQEEGSTENRSSPPSTAISTTKNKNTTTELLLQIQDNREPRRASVLTWCAELQTISNFTRCEAFQSNFVGSEQNKFGWKPPIRMVFGDKTPRLVCYLDTDRFRSALNDPSCSLDNGQSVQGFPNSCQ